MKEKSGKIGIIIPRIIAAVCAGLLCLCVLFSPVAGLTRRAFREIRKAEGNISERTIEREIGFEIDELEEISFYKCAHYGGSLRESAQEYLQRGQISSNVWNDDCDMAVLVGQMLFYIILAFSVLTLLFAAFGLPTATIVFDIMTIAIVTSIRYVLQYLLETYDAENMVEINFTGFMYYWIAGICLLAFSIWLSVAKSSRKAKKKTEATVNKTVVPPPVFNSPIYNDVPQRPMYNQPIYNNVPQQPVYNPPVYNDVPQQPVYNPPVYNDVPQQPVYNSPVYNDVPQQPMYNPPVYNNVPPQPVYNPPVYNDVPQQPVQDDEKTIGINDLMPENNVYD